MNDSERESGDTQDEPGPPGVPAWLKISGAVALASLLTGILMALGTKWGLVRYYWVLVSFVLTTFATSILLLHMPDVSTLADRARAARGSELGGDLFHAGVGLAILPFVLALNIAKPEGLTRYGWRRQARTRTS